MEHPILHHHRSYWTRKVIPVISKLSHNLRMKLNFPPHVHPKGDGNRRQESNHCTPAVGLFPNVDRLVRIGQCGLRSTPELELLLMVLT